MIDGINADRDSVGPKQCSEARCERKQIINRLDPNEIVYHHSSGNLGTMHTMNFYLNFVPIQELDDWYEHWAAVGVKPAFMVEYGVPFSWDWGMYRGWYKGQRSFGNAQVPWEYCMAEWNAQFLGDSAYNISEAEKKNLRWEANKFKTSDGWYRWDYPYPMGSTDPAFEDQQKVWAEYTTDNWRAFRTWGVSGISPWETFGVFWRLKDGVNRGRVELKTDWDNLQKPGYSPDYIDGRYERRDMAYTESDWVPTTGGKSLIRANKPVLEYIGGKPGAFTDKAHDFRVGETVEKQLIVVNNSRETAKCVCTWSMAPVVPTSDGISVKSQAFLTPVLSRVPESAGLTASGADGREPTSGRTSLVVATGDILNFPLRFAPSTTFQPGKYKLMVKVEFLASNFPDFETQTDEFVVDILPALPKASTISKLAIYDPAGETIKLLTSLGVSGATVVATSSLSNFDTLIIGKHALTADGPGLDLSRVRTGLKVIMFEQSSEVLEKRFGFRVQEYGLRNVFPRVPDHPVLVGLDTETLRDWRGSATNMAPRGTYEMAQQFNGAPSVVRSGILEPRVWRCGNRGDVASVLIEKPAIGDFLPIVDGGFSLQYSPLMEYHEGKGMVVFCQMDVTGRTESDPAAERLVTNLLNYTTSWKPGPERRLVLLGGADAKQHLINSGYSLEEYRGKLATDQIFLMEQGAPIPVVSDPDSLKGWRAIGGLSVTVGVAPSQLSAVGSPRKSMDYINSVLDPPTKTSLLAGIGPADVYNRDPRPIPATSNGGVLEASSDGSHVSLNLAPWTFDVSKPNTKRVFRHTSFALSRILGNMGVHAATPLIERFASPVKAGEQRWLKGVLSRLTGRYRRPLPLFRLVERGRGRFLVRTRVPDVPVRSRGFLRERRGRPCCETGAPMVRCLDESDLGTQTLGPG